MQKKAQVSIFLIVAIVLVLGSIAGYYLYTGAKEKEAEAKAAVISQRSQASEQIRSFFEECVKKVSYDGLKIIGSQGGYASIPPSFEMGGVAYWQYDSANVQPFLNGTKQEYIRYLEEQIPSCVDDSAISQQGFSLKKGEMSASAEFGDSDVSVLVSYPLTLTMEDFSASYDEFSHRIDIPYRRIFEAASELNKHVLLPAFDPAAPLQGAPQYGFSLEYERKGEGKFQFSTIDNSHQTPDGVPYRISFGAKLGLSPLVKRTTIQNLSSTQPTPYDFEINSPDNRAVLFISRDTTITQDGQGVGYIDVKQNVEGQVVSSNVPNAKKNKDIVGRTELAYVTDHTIYNFEPDGLLFSTPQKLTIKYDDNGKIAGGVGMLQGHNGFWFPLRSFDDKENKEVTAYIAGFTDFTAVDCGSQGQKTVSAEHFLEPSAGCYAKLGLSVVLLALTFAYPPGLLLENVAGGFAPGIGAIETGAMSGIQGAFGTVGSHLGNMLGLGLTTPAQMVMVGGVFLGAMAVSFGLTVAGLADPTLFYTDAPENCQTYIPTCQQAINIQKEEEDGEGACFPESQTETSAGQPSTLCAQVKKCNFIQSFFCMPCSVKCTASYK